MNLIKIKKLEGALHAPFTPDIRGGGGGGGGVCVHNFEGGTPPIYIVHIWTPFHPIEQCGATKVLVEQ